MIYKAFFEKIGKFLISKIYFDIFLYNFSKLYYSYKIYPDSSDVQYKLTSLVEAKKRL